MITEIYNVNGYDATLTEATEEEIKSEFPMIVCQVPSQRNVFARVCQNVMELREFAEYEGGDNWEFPGHRENPDDEESDWIDDATISDMKEAINHDMWTTYFISRADFPEWNPGHHQATAARLEVNKMAEFLDWLAYAKDNEE